MRAGAESIAGAEPGVLRNGLWTITPTIVASNSAQVVACFTAGSASLQIQLSDPVNGVP